MARILPDRSATPKRVREYLAQTLTANHDVPLDRATELALRWEYGRGSDLQDSTDSDLDDLLGRPLGQYLFNSLREDKVLKWRRSTAGVLYRCQSTRIDLDGYVANTRTYLAIDATFGATSALLLSIAYAYKDFSLQTSGTYS